MTYTRYFFRRSRDLGTISVYMGHRDVRCLPPYVYIWEVYILCPLINNPHPEEVIISQPKTSFLGVVFDVDHDFEGPRAPKAHLDTVNRNLLDHLRRPFSSLCMLLATLSISKHVPPSVWPFERERTNWDLARTGSLPLGQHQPYPKFSQTSTDCSTTYAQHKALDSTSVLGTTDN